MEKDYEKLLAQANQHFIEESFTQAIQIYGQVLHELKIDKNENKEDFNINQLLFRAALNRSSAFEHANEYKKAFNDVDYVINTFLKGGQIFSEGYDRFNSQAQFRYGICQFYLNLFDEAIKSFNKSKQFDNENYRKQSKYNDWIEKCESKLKAKINLPEKSKTEEIILKQKKSIDSTTLKKFCSCKYSNLELPLRTTFIQNKEWIKYTIFAKNIDNQDVNVHFQSDSCSIEIKDNKCLQNCCHKEENLSNKINTKRTIDNAELSQNYIFKQNLRLQGFCIPNKSRYIVNPYKIIIEIKKKDPDYIQKNLERSLNDLKPFSVNNDSKINYITSANIQQSKDNYPYSSKKRVDQDKFNREVSKEEDNEKLDGDQAVNKLFQDIYSKADDDTKRAMIKSMQTSCGTVLSTNQSEVKDHDYSKDIQPPKGSEIRRQQE